MPALAFNQTTGIEIHTITPIVMTICIFYTCLGGIKAVVWTDVIQIILMYGTLLLIVVRGTMLVGGLSVVLERNLESGRFEAPEYNYLKLQLKFSMTNFLILFKLAFVLIQQLDIHFGRCLLAVQFFG